MIYTAQQGQNIRDVCLQTYGDFKFLVKLMLENNFSNINVADIGGRKFIFDENLVKNYSLFNRNNNENITYLTDLSKEDLLKQGKSYDMSFDLSFD